MKQHWGYCMILNVNEIVSTLHTQTARGSRKEQIQKQIKKTDREIDALVYELYGITDEERKVIEKDLDAVR